MTTIYRKRGSERVFGRGYDLMATIVSACPQHNPHGYRAAIRKQGRDSIQLPLAGRCCRPTHLRVPSSSIKFNMVAKSANKQLSSQKFHDEVSLSPWSPQTRITRYFSNVGLAESATIALAVVAAVIQAVRLATKRPIRSRGGRPLKSNPRGEPAKVREDTNEALLDKPVVDHHVTSLLEERNCQSLQEVENTGAPKQAQGGFFAGDGSKSLTLNRVYLEEITAGNNGALALLTEPGESPFVSRHPDKSGYNFHVPSPSRVPIRSCPEEIGIISRDFAVDFSSCDRPLKEDGVDGTLCPPGKALSDDIAEDCREDDEDDVGVNSSGFITLSEAEPNKTLIVPCQMTDADSLQPYYFGLHVDSQPLPINRPLNANAKEEQQSSLNRTIQAAVPAIAIGAGAFGAVTGVEGALEMVGFVATASFVAYELLWAQTRNQLWEDLGNVTDHKKLMSFLKSRNIIKYF